MNKPVKPPHVLFPADFEPTCKITPTLEYLYEKCDRYVWDCLPDSDEDADFINGAPEKDPMCYLYIFEYPASPPDMPPVELALSVGAQSSLWVELCVADKEDSQRKTGYPINPYNLMRWVRDVLSDVFENSYHNDYLLQDNCLDVFFYVENRDNLGPIRWELINRYFSLINVEFVDEDGNPPDEDDDPIYALLPKNLVDGERALYRWLSTNKPLIPPVFSQKNAA